MYVVSFHYLFIIIIIITIMDSVFSLLLLVALIGCTCVFSFQCRQTTFRSSSRAVTASTIRSSLSMEYIPDGLSKKQWEEMKKKEAEDLKKKNLGAVGITKFQSRSFEAWQKSGGKNLFPVDPTKPLESRPYMQRPGGSADGTDLKAKGLKGKEQGVASKLNAADAKYDELGKQGKLKSTPFSLPWTNEDTQKITANNIKAKREAAKVEPARKGAVTKKTTAAPVVSEEEPPKKKFFGLF